MSNSHERVVAARRGLGGALSTSLLVTALAVSGSVLPLPIVEIGLDGGMRVRVGHPAALADMPGLAAAYGFSESSGTTTADASGNNNTGTLLGGSTRTTSGKYGNAMSFNGTNASVRIPDSPTWKVNGLTGYTVSMWIKAKSASGDYKAAIGKGSWPSDDIKIVKVGNAWHYKIRTTALGCGGQTAPLAYLSTVDNTYHHVAMVLDTTSGRCDFYSDGQIVGSDDYATGTTVFATGTGLNDLFIGGLNGGSQYLNADIDEVRVYTRTLTQTEIQADMATPVDGGAPADTTPPVISGTAAGNLTPTSATITWTTDEPADSQVEYGLTTGYGQSTTLDPAFFTAHSQLVSGLSAGTLYHYRARSKDAAGNGAVSSDFTFTTTTGPPGDTTPPVISSVSSSGVTQAAATITWTTDEPADGRVEYGLTTSYGSSTSMNPALVTGHSETLSGLSANTLYHYRVHSKDAAGNTAASGDLTLTTQPASVGFQEILVAQGLSSPTAMDFAPDGRLFVAEKTGALRVITAAGQLLPTPFFTATVASNGEQGLLGIAFHPNFAANQHIYVYYTAPAPQMHNRISRLTANGSVAVPGSETILLELPVAGTGGTIAHQGGAIHFGTDGKLYVAVGDHQVPENARELTNPFGKLLRINADGTIPTDNPFYGQTSGVNQAIYAIGFRNPFTFAVDPMSGRIFVNDVGEATWEEINQLSPGGNYGWPTCEGPQGTGVGSCNDPAFTYPLHAYLHAPDNEGAVTGGAFYRANQFPIQYVGDYFFSDYTANWIRFLDSSNQTPGVNNPSTDFRSASLPVDLKVGPDGSLYYLAIFPGEVFKIEYASGNLNPTAVISALPTTGQAPLQVNFDASGSSDPDLDPLTYGWDFGDGTPAESGVTVSHAYQTTGVYTATLTVSDGRGGTDVATQPISVGTPPVATILTPADGTLYSAGDTIPYSGSATDAEDGTLPAGAYSWTIVFHHLAHTHPFLGPVTGVTGGSFQIPPVGETSTDVWYRIHLTVTDSDGITDEVTRDVTPNIVTLTLASSPPGATLTLDGQPAPAPITTPGVVGISRTIGAPTPQVIGGTQHQFGSWSDGGAATHTITTPPSDTTYTATFQPVPGPVTSAWYFPSAQAAVTSGAGDNNGHEGAPGNLLADDGALATDTNSGTSSSTGCGNSGKDRHLLRDFTVTLPSGTTTLKGIEVRVDGLVDSPTNAPKFCLHLSWNGGTSWTSAKSTPTLSTTEQGYILGSTTDLWGRSSWTTSQLSNPNFRVRITSVASSTARDFSVDTVAVRVTAQ